MQQVQHLDRIFLALADSGRRGMIEQLARGPATVKELARPAGMGLPSAVKHLKLLEEGGIVVSNKSGRTRTFTMRRNAFSPIQDWMHAREEVLNAGFDRLVQAIAAFPEEDKAEEDQQ